MTKVLPIAAGWTRTTDDQPGALPGADRLAAFGALLGELPTTGEAPFEVPGLLPEDEAAGELSIRLPLARLGAARAEVFFPLLRGRGVALIDGEETARFEEGSLTLPIPDEATRTGRCRLTLRFDDSRPAGIALPPLLREPQVAKKPRFWLPLSNKEASGDPEALIAELAALKLPAVQLPAGASVALWRALHRSGIVPLGPEAAPLPQPDTAAAAWALCGLLSAPRPLPEGMTEEEALRLTFGREEPPDAAPLQALLLRLRLDAALAGHYAGPLAPAGALGDPALHAAWQAAARPHVAALPLFGAWWCGSAFSCRLVPLGLPASTQIEAYFTGEGALEARSAFSAPTSALFTARLPEEPTVLQLLIRSSLPNGEVIEETLPVPVGRRAQMEAWVS